MFTLKTSITKKGEIKHELIDSLENKMSQWIIDTEEKHNREALIELGWIPPDRSFNINQNNLIKTSSDDKLI